MLRLDSSKARERLGWAPRWGLEEGLEAIVDWYLGLQGGEDVRGLTVSQIDRFAAADPARF